jgi:hypothetical protein
MLKEYEREAVFALMVRVVEASRLQEVATVALQHASSRSTEAAEVIRNARQALKLFGFTDEDKLWDQVRASLGEEKYQGAFTEAAHFTPGTLERKSADDVLQGESQAGEETLTNVDVEPPMQAEDQNIKELVLRHLKDAGESGILASTIKDALRAQGIAMHEKTVGMNLWRLSQDNLSRREGRTWFYIPREHGDGLAEGHRGDGASAEIASE